MQVVGVGPDPTKNQFYFSDKTGHKIFRAGMDMPEGKTHADRDDVELLYVDTKARVASSLDIELDLKARRIYWTDKDQNIVFGMAMDMPAGQDANTRTDVDSVVTGMTGVIGLAFDPQESVLYSTHGGSVSSFKPDGSGLKQIGSNGSTGIAFVRLP
jgi:sugar lactone lactonase YvrE